MTDLTIGLLLSVFLALGSMTPQAAPQAAGGASSMIQGSATWYDAPSSTDAAAGPALRVGNWRGSWVVVRHGSREVRVQLTDWCFCGGDRLIDLDDVAFARLAPLSRGVIDVEVEAGGPVLPATDTLEGE